MKVEKIEALSLDNDSAKKYAAQIATSKLGLPIKSVKYLGGGSFGKAVLIELEDGKKIVIKFLIARDMLEKEVYDLKLLAEHCSVKIPKVLFSQTAGENIPIDCYAMEYIEGKNALMSIGLFFKSKRKRLEFADKVTTAMREIHSHTNENFGDTLSPNCTNFLDYYKPFAQAVLCKAEELFQDKKLSLKIIKAMRAAWAKFDVIFSEKIVEACLIHGDLNVANIMIDDNCNLCAFIDPLNSMYADREYDLFQFDNLTGKRFFLRETYIKKYGASKYCDAKCAFYGLWNEVYCYIKSGVLVNFIMNPLIKNMYKRLKDL